MRLELYREGVARKIVLTGGKQAGDRFTEAFTGFTYLRKAGVPDSDLVVITDGANTWESLAAAATVEERRSTRRGDGVRSVPQPAIVGHRRRLGNERRCLTNRAGHRLSPSAGRDRCSVAGKTHRVPTAAALRVTAARRPLAVVTYRTTIGVCAVGHRALKSWDPSGVV